MKTYIVSITTSLDADKLQEVLVEAVWMRSPFISRIDVKTETAGPSNSNGNGHHTQRELSLEPFSMPTQPDACQLDGG